MCVQLMIEENSPLGWLVFFGTMAFIAIFAFGMDKKRFKNPDPRLKERRQDYSVQWRYTNQATCPKCGSSDIRFDYGRMIDYDTTGICKDCGYTWVWQGSDKP